eukprot:4478692-Amphidinium_carterae.1
MKESLCGVVAKRLLKFLRPSPFRTCTPLAFACPLLDVWRCATSIMSAAGRYVGYALPTLATCRHLAYSHCELGGGAGSVH